MKILTLFLSILIFIQTSSAAATEHKRLSSGKKINLSSAAAKYGKKFSGNKNFNPRMYRKVLRSIENNKVAKVLGHQAQTILLILSLSIIDLIRSHFEDADLRGADINKEKLAENISEATEMVLNSGEIWTSIIGAGVTSGLGSYHLAQFNSYVSNLETRAIFKNLLVSGAGTMVTFGGWEFGGELYNQAIGKIDDEDDYELAESLGAMLKGVMNNGMDSREGVLLKQVLSNMYEILFEDEEKRALWTYNTWRNRFATGHFNTLVAAMVGASAIGTTIFPGAGTIVGLMFGFAGGVASLFVPHEYNEAITDFYRKRRQEFHGLGMDHEKGFFFKAKEKINSFFSDDEALDEDYGARGYVINTLGKVLRGEMEMPSMLSYSAFSNKLKVYSDKEEIEESMPEVRTSKDMYLTTRFEKLFSIESEILLNQDRLRLSIVRTRQEKDPEKYNEIAKDIRKLAMQRDEELEKITNLYKNEYEYLLDAIKRNDLIKYRTPEYLEKYPILGDIFAELFRIEGLYLIFRDDLSQSAKLPESYEEKGMYLDFVSVFYQYGYIEDVFVEKLEEE